MIVPSRQGVGSRLIQGASPSAFNPQASFAFEPDGLIFDLSFAVDVVS